MSASVKLGPESAWKATLQELEQQMTKATFNTWLKGARLGRVDTDGGKLRFVIYVRNDYAVDWLENRLHDSILRTLTAIIGEDVALAFQVKSDFEVPEPEMPPLEMPLNGNGAAPPPPASGMTNGRNERKRNESDGDNDGNVPVRYRRIRPPTDPLGGFVRTSHYAVRFWRPYLGADLFDLLQIISSYAYEFEVLGKDGPTLKTLVNKLGRGDISKLIGRPATVSKGKQYAAVPGLLNELRDHNLCHHHSDGKGRGQKQYFDYLTKIEDLPLLTPKQVAKLSAEDQIEHQEWLELHTGSDVEAWRKDERETAVMVIPLGEYA